MTFRKADLLLTVFAFLMTCAGTVFIFMDSWRGSSEAFNVANIFLWIRLLVWQIKL